MLKSGNLDITAEPEVVAEGASWLVVDGHRSSGQWAVTVAVDHAVEKARETGVAIALGRNHNDTGCLSAFTAHGMRQGMITMAANNSPPLVAPWGGMQNLMGATPFSLAAPGGDDSLPVVVDVEFIDADNGKSTLAMLQGEKLPGKWLVDPETGETSDDPGDFLVEMPGTTRMSMLQAAGLFSSPRIYALNCAAEILSAVIVPGGVLSPDVPHPLPVWSEFQPTTSTGGSFVLAIDPSCFQEMQDYREKIDRFVSTIKSAKKLPGVEEIYLPGERGLRAQDNARVQVAQPYWDSFETIAAEFGLEIDDLRTSWAGSKVATAD
jgi:LDH2 family malate/lactate/ureidoglycolate dehydrogenase